MSRAIVKAFRMCSRKVRYATSADAQRDQPDMRHYSCPICAGWHAATPPAAKLRAYRRLKHRIQAIIKFVLAGRLKADACVPDLDLCTHQPLRHGLRRHHKAGCNLLCGQAEHRLQHQRRSHRLLNRGVRAGKQQA